MSVPSRLHSLRPCLHAIVLAAACALAGTGRLAAQDRDPTSRPTEADSRVRRSDNGVVYPNSMGPLRPIQMPKLIFFPPNPPPVGVSIDLPDAGEVLSRAPIEMQSFVTEPFYAPLSTFISPVVTGYQGGETMSTRETTDLKNFMRLRAALLAELREKIAALETADATTRLRQFEAFAGAQTGRLLELEKLAEKIRASLARKADWSELRQWRLGPGYQSASRGALRKLEQQVVRAAAFYVEGLSPAQRRLVRELAMEMEDAIYHPDDAAVTGQALLFFQPETSRIRLPDDLPTALAKKIRAYRDEKSRLKKELGDAIYRHDGEFFTAARSQALRRLADKQKDRLDELEEQAEEIRQALAREPEFPRAKRPASLPPAVVARIEKFRAVDRGLQQRTGEGLNEAIANGTPLPPRDTPLARREWLQAWSARFQRNGKTLSATDLAAMEAQIKELDAIHDQLELVTGTKLEMADGFAPDGFLDRQAAQEKSGTAAYEYDIAALEPGLSPEQRRLLFGAAMEGLDLPLPGAEPQPTLAPGTMIR